MAQGRQFPVEHGQDARLGRVENHVVEPEVAMHDGRVFAGRNVVRQPGDQLVHRAMVSVCEAWYCLVQRSIWRAK
jgi:hypothetical protein